MSQNEKTILTVIHDEEIFTLIQKTIQTTCPAQIFRAINPTGGIGLLRQYPKADLLITEEFGDIQYNALIQNWIESAQWKKIPLILLVKEITHAKLKHYRTYHIQHVLPLPLQPQDFFSKLESALGIEGRVSLKMIEVLRKTDFFQDFRLEELNELLNMGYLKQFQKDKVLVKEKGHLDKLGFLLKGEVGVYQITKSGEAILAQELEPYALLGETSLLTRSRSFTRVVSHTDSIFLMIPYFAVQLLSDEVRERIYRLIIRELTRKLRAMTADMFLDEDSPK